MNRYVTAGLHEDAHLAGKQVLVVCHRAEVSGVLQAFTDLPPQCARIRRTNGSEEITFDSGGSIRFAASDLAIRGRTVDVVFIEPTHLGLLHHAELAVAARAGEVIRA